MTTFDPPTSATKDIPAAVVAAIAGNPPFGKYYVPDSHLSPLDRNRRAISRVLSVIETNLETLRALEIENQQLTSERPQTQGEET